MKVSKIYTSNVILFLALISVAMVGCSGSAGGSSPEDVFAKFQKATENDDYKGAFNCLEETTQNGMVAGMVIMSGFMVMGDDDATKKLEEVMKKHNLDDLDEKEMEKYKGDQKAAMDFVASKVKDKAQFFADVMGIAAKAKNAGDNSFAMKGELKDVKTDGDKATGTVTLKGGKEEPINFVKVDGRWLIKLDMEM